MPKDTDIATEFLSEHPTYRVISVYIGEGDSDAAYYHISYKKPSDDTVYEDICLYLKSKNGSFIKQSCEHSDFELKK